MSATTLMKQITSSYLYGSLTPPTDKDDESLIRPNNVVPVATTSITTHMNIGAGRFAKASQFEVVQEFFNTGNAIPAGTYSFLAILTLLGLADPNIDYSKIAIDQKEYSGGGDYLERVFVYNNSSFKIDISAGPTFHVDSGGTRTINDLRITPETENWDFETSANDTDTSELNKALRAFIDSSDALIPAEDDGLGRKVEIQFTGTAPLDTSYSSADFTSDTNYIATEKGTFGSIEKLALGVSLRNALQDFWDNGYTDFINSDEQPLLFGTDDDDVIDAREIEGIYNESWYANWFGTATIDDLEEFETNGTHIIAGKGDDIITGDQWDDVLDGGEGNDIITGLDGFDLVDYKRFDYATTSSDIASYQITVVDRVAGQFDITITFTDSTVEEDEINSIERIAHAEVEANTFDSNNQTIPVIAGVWGSTDVDNDGFITFWQSANQESGLSATVHGQRFDSSGNPLGSELDGSLLNERQYDPATAGLNNGSAVVVFKSTNSFGSGQSKTFATIVNETGGSVADDVEVFENPLLSGGSQDTNERTYEYLQDVARLSNGNIIVVAQAQGKIGGVSLNGVDLIGQVLSSSGVLIGSKAILHTETGSQSDPSVTGLAGGGFVVTWTSYDGNSDGIFARLYDNSMAATGSAFVVNTTTTGRQFDSDVAALAGGGFVVVWQGPDTGSDGTFFKMFDESGNVVVGETRVNSVVPDGQIEPQVTALADGGFVVTFTESSANGDGSGYSVWAQQYDLNGDAVQDNFLVNVSTVNSQRFSNVGMMEDGDFVTTWYGAGPTGTGEQIFTRMYSNSAPIPEEEMMMAGVGGGQSALQQQPDELLYGEEEDYLVQSFKDTYWEDLNRNGQADRYVASKELFQSGYSETIDGFSVKDGDVLDLSNILSGHGKLDRAIEDYIQMFEAESNTYVLIDQDGRGDRHDFQMAAVLQKAPNLTLEELINSGNMLV